MKIHILFVLFLVLIIGCTSQDTVVVENDSNGSVLEKVLEIQELPEGVCAVAWKCISSSFRAYQLENCSFAQRKECPHGCEEGVCTALVKTGQNCASGFKCKSSYSKAFQTESCTWISETKCEFGCAYGECSVKPNETAGESASVPSVYTLKANEEQTVGNHTVRIYILEEGRVRLQIDDKRSDWLQSGQKFTVGDVTITIRDILFQPYGGGTQAVEYVVG